MLSSSSSRLAGGAAAAGRRRLLLALPRRPLTRQRRFLDLVGSPLNAAAALVGGSSWSEAARRSFAASSSPPGSGGGGRGGGDGSSGTKKPPSRAQQLRSRIRPTGNANRKENFDERILRPASRGELAGTKHRSGIPKLAARKHKARLDPHHERGPPRFLVQHTREDDEDEWQEILDMDDEEAEQAAAVARKGGIGMQQPAAGEGGEEEEEEGDGYLLNGTVRSYYDFFGDSTSLDDYYAPELIDDDRYYWREEEYEPLGESENAAADDELSLRGVDGNGIGGEVDDVANEEHGGVEGDAGGGDGGGDENVAAGDGRGRGRDRGRDAASPASNNNDMEYFYDQNNIIDIAALGPEHFEEQNQYDDDDDEVEELRRSALPLRDHGPDLDDFLEAMMEHPTEYAHIERRYLHPDSCREPKPIFAHGGKRVNPPIEFVDSFARFLYVTGLPPFDVSGEPNDIDNPTHRSILQKTIAKLVGVDSEHVCAADASSAFVGFSSPLALASALRRGPTESSVSFLPTISPFRPDSHDGESDSDGVKEFVETAPESVVEISEIPPGHTATSFTRLLFPDGSEVQTVYGNVSTDDIYFRSPTSVLIRFTSEEQALSAVDSVLLGEQLNLIGRYTVRYFRARRELVHAGFDGPARSEEMREMGPRLIVDGEMPSKKFFLPHARLIHVRNLDTTLSKEEISEAFQPYCGRQRDVYGSIELVTCEAGIPTGCAYVGFDSVGEAEAAIRALSGTIILGDRRASLRLVKDRMIPGRPLVRPEGRPERNIDELLDDLDNWEKYIDPEDLEFLEGAGISKVALDEVFRSIRYKNRTFGPFDSGLRNESLEPDKARGEQYKELVQMYIETLKECIPTRDNVGEMYEAMHFPDEPIDLSIFDKEIERQQKLLEKRANP